MKEVRGTRSPRCKRQRMAAIHQFVTEELAMQEGFNVDRRRLCGAAAAAVAAGPVGLAGPAIRTLSSRSWRQGPGVTRGNIGLN
jgi:hypothetical protein